jgi:hypothetical protein
LPVTPDGSPEKIAPVPPELVKVKEEMAVPRQTVCTAGLAGDKVHCDQAWVPNPRIAVRISAAKTLILGLYILYYI